MIKQKDFLKSASTWYKMSNRLHKNKPYCTIYEQGNLKELHGC